MNYPAKCIHIRLFSYLPVYFVTQTKVEINTYLYDIYFRYPAIIRLLFSFCPTYVISFWYPVIRIHIWLLIFRPLSTFSKSWQELLRRNGPRKPWAITPREPRLADGSGFRSDDTTISIGVGLVMSGPRSQLKSMKNCVCVRRRDMWGLLLEGPRSLERLPLQNRDQLKDQ